MSCHQNGTKNKRNKKRKEVDEAECRIIGISFLNDADAMWNVSANISERDLLLVLCPIQHEIDSRHYCV